MAPLCWLRGTHSPGSESLPASAIARNPRTTATTVPHFLVPQETKTRGFLKIQILFFLFIYEECILLVTYTKGHIKAES